MFGMGFSELLVIAVIAILFLGPDKLPSTLVEIAKFFRSMKQTVNSVKDSINEEIHLEEIKKEALAYKQQLMEAESKINSSVNLSHLDDEINSLIDDEPKTKQSKRDESMQELLQMQKNQQQPQQQTKEEPQITKEETTTQINKEENNA